MPLSNKNYRYNINKAQKRIKINGTWIDYDKLGEAVSIIEGERFIVRYVYSQKGGVVVYSIVADLNYKPWLENKQSTKKTK